MATTKIDSAESGAAARDHQPARECRRSTAALAARCAVSARSACSRPAVAIAGAVLASDVPVGPGRFLVCVLVVAWSAAAFVVATQRPREILSWLMVAGAAIGAVALVAAAEAGKAHPAGSASYKIDSALLAISLALLPALGLHIALGLPRGSLEHGVRRGIAIAGYVAAVPLAASLYSERSARIARHTRDCRRAWPRRSA